jgi:tetratricopeptide (TPR) repeat protein
MRCQSWLLLGFLASSLALESQPIFGEEIFAPESKVVTKYGARVHAGTKIVDDGTVFRVYQVERTDADRIWLVAEGACGWVDRSQVLRLSNAADFYTGELRVKPESPEAYRRRGMVLAATGETQRAFADLESAIRLEPTSAAAFVDRGVVWLENREFARAQADLDKAIRLDTKNAFAYHARGAACYFAGKLDAALNDYDKAIELNPMFAVAYANRAMLWCGQRKFEKALRDLDAAIALNPNFPRAFGGRSQVWSEMGLTDKALSDLDEAIRLNRFDADALFRRAEIWRDRGQIRNALTDYSECLRLDPHQSSALNKRGALWLVEGERALAFKDFSQAIRLNPGYSGAFGNRAVLSWSEGDFKKARDDFNEALRLDPKNRLANRNLALLLATCTDASFRSGKTAIALATRACELGEWSDPQDLGALAAACAEVGDYRRAIAECEKALMLSPTPAQQDEINRSLAVYRDGKALHQERGASVAQTNVGGTANEKAEGGTLAPAATPGQPPEPDFIEMIPPRSLELPGTSRINKQVGGHADQPEEIGNIALQRMWPIVPAKFEGLPFEGEHGGRPGADAVLPRTAKDFLLRGSSRSLDGDFDKALADYDEAIRLNPSDALGFMLRAQLLQCRGDVEKALADLNEALRRCPTDPQILVNRGGAWLAKGHWQNAMADFDRAVRLGDSSGAALSNRAAIWMLGHNYTQAIADYTEAIKLSPGNPWLLIARAAAFESMSDYARALADYDEAIRHDPKSGEAHCGRAWLLASCPDQQLRNGRGAVESATRACELSNWKNADSIEALAAAHAEAGQFEEAIRHQETAARLITDSHAQTLCKSRLGLYKQRRPWRRYGDRPKSEAVS